MYKDEFGTPVYFATIDPPYHVRPTKEHSIIWVNVATDHVWTRSKHRKNSAWHYQAGASTLLYRARQIRGVMGVLSPLEEKIRGMFNTNS
jgi:hypothetical protein